MLFRSTFDDEGIACHALTLIDKGNLSNFLHNSATAKEMNQKNNARAGRGAKGSLGVSSTQLAFLAGNDTDQDVKANEYLEIVSLQGLHSGVDVISGDFSFGGSGFLVKNGVRLQAVRNVTISGNFYDLILNLGAVGNKVYANSDRSFFSPMMRFENISVAGK